MWALEQPWEPRATPLFSDTPLRLLAVLGAALAGAATLQMAGWLPPPAVRVIGVAVGHGALLATALAWARPASRERHAAFDAGFAAVLLLGLAAGAATVHPMGALGYLGPPLWVWRLAARGRLGALGLGGAVAPRALLVGALAGVALGAHLLVSASLTLGHQTRLDALDRILGALAYDLGANVLSAECFFRGALFNRAQRRWSFAAGAVVSTAACLARYLVDPLLPRTVEMTVGMLFYVSLLSVLNCWLLWWSGSLLPGLLAALLFFAAYRGLGAG